MNGTFGEELGCVNQHPTHEYADESQILKHRTAQFK